MRNSLVFSVPVLSSSESWINAAAAKTPFPVAIKMRWRPWGARHVHCNEQGGRAVVRDVKVEKVDLEGNREKFGTGPRHIDPGARARELRRPNATASLISSRRRQGGVGCEAGEADRAGRGLSDSGKNSQGWNWTNTGSELIINSFLGVKGSWGSSWQAAC